MVDPSQVDHVTIFPRIGFARVGNSFQQDYGKGWYYAPEIPGRFDEPEGGYKDAAGNVKRQAARFRAYAFDNEGHAIYEIIKDDGFELEWTIQVANKKPSWYVFMGSEDTGAFQPGYRTLRNPTVQPDIPPDQRTKLIVDSGVHTINSSSSEAPQPLQGEFFGSKDKPTTIYLGEASTDDQGRLVVKAGRGKSMSIAQEGDEYPLILTDFDSPDWIDDTCDGWITVKVTHKDSGTIWKSVVKARVIGTTPKFVAGVYAPTTLYDLMEEIYERERRKAEGEKYTVGEVGWYAHIWPLLQRPPLLSWVNVQANGGHGPNGPGNFFDDRWQKSLSDKTVFESDSIRKGVLGRMRLPSTNGKYDQARAGQAYPYFMPWLSGDGGRTTAGNASTFTSVTELQYDRLHAWAEGNFRKPANPPEPFPDDFEDIHIRGQPAALNRASLEATIGAPLYPGIEMSWNAELSETYNLKLPFCIREDVQPGDLTKYLSLPWQSDFYMCRSYWWPSARPDTIVTEKSYLNATKSVAKEDVAKSLNNRVPWERGIHQNYTDVYGDQPLFANTDMAQRWHKLGFIVQRPSFGPEPIFVETQRGVLEKEDFHGILEPSQSLAKSIGGNNQKSIIQGHPVSLPPGGITLPTPDSVEHPIKTVASLREHLQAAMAVELCSIPLYLAGMYSVRIPADKVNDPRYYDPVIGAVRNVVSEEMLHLSLAGNILRAVGGTPKLYQRSTFPTYPMPMPGRVPLLILHLRSMTKPHMETFVEFEKPEEPNAKPEPDHYKTLGQFYDAIKEGLKYLNKDPGLFHPEFAPFQFAPGLGYQAQVRDAGGSVIVTDLASAERAIEIIVDQGEGNKSPWDDPDHLEKAHFTVFSELKDGDQKWEVYPTLTDPTTIAYLDTYKDRRIYQVSVVFDAAYCFLLLTIEKLWTIEKDDVRHKLVLGNMFSIMMGVLAPLAKFLVQQPVGYEGKVASACFGWYSFDDGKSALKQLQKEMQSAIDEYVSVTRETPDQVAVHNYGPQLEMLLPIQTTIKGLLDLDTFTKLDHARIKVTQPGIQTRGAKGFARGF
jgi:hypothetical protein